MDVLPDAAVLEVVSLPRRFRSRRGGIHAPRWSKAVGEMVGLVGRGEVVGEVLCDRARTKTGFQLGHAVLGPEFVDLVVHVLIRLEGHGEFLGDGSAGPAKPERQHQ